jgi:hypothetical protein
MDDGDVGQVDVDLCTVFSSPALPPSLIVDLICLLSRNSSTLEQPTLPGDDAIGR